MCKITVRGGWKPEDARRFGRALKKRVNAAGKAGRRWHVLLDMTGSAPQSQETLTLIDRILAPVSYRRVAVLAHHAVTLFQPAACPQTNGKRIYSYFWSSEEQAIRWLLDEEQIQSQNDMKT